MITHLRMIHFSLVIVSGVVLYSLLTPSSSLYLASQQISKLVDFSNSKSFEEFPNGEIKLINVNPLIKGFVKMTDGERKLDITKKSESNEDMVEVGITILSFLEEMYIDSWDSDYSDELEASRVFYHQKGLTKETIDATIVKIEVTKERAEISIEKGSIPTDRVNNSRFTTLASLIRYWNRVAQVKYVPDSMDTTFSMLWRGRVYETEEAYDKWLANYKMRYPDLIIGEEAIEEIISELSPEDLYWCDDEGTRIKGSPKTLTEIEDIISICYRVGEEEEFSSLIGKFEFTVENVPWNPMGEYLIHIGNPYAFSDTRFELAFNDLYKFMGDFKEDGELTLDAIKAMLDYLVKSTGDKVSIFGLNVQQTTVAVLGPLAIIFMQLYFALHFNTLRNCLSQKVKKTVTTPWIVLYQQNWISRLITLLTLIILPVAASSLPAIQNFISDINYDWQTVTGVVAVLCISTAIAGWTYVINREFICWQYQFEFSEIPSDVKINQTV